MPILRRIASFALAATVLTTLRAQVPVRDAAELQKQLDRLQTLGSVLYLAAHPDDENTFSNSMQFQNQCDTRQK